MKYRCKIKKKNEDDKQNIYNELLELKKINENLEKRIKQLESEKKSVNVKSNNVNSFNNIIFVGYGNENLKKIIPVRMHKKGSDANNIFLKYYL